jgi:ubiquinone/menaquinone biosynthesis C-methylase UbiE
MAGLRMSAAPSSLATYRRAYGLSMSFDESLKARSATDYADFLLQHLNEDFCVLDVGCGEGTITVGLAETVGHVVGVDPDGEGFADATRYIADHQIHNVEFRVGSVYALDFPSDHCDACLCHSMLETLAHPLDGLLEIKRTLKPGGILGVACVEYGGLILAGPNDKLLRRFFAIRERVWQLENAADPYRGRHLRSLLERAGFEGVVATSKFFCYGTSEAVRSFGVERAEECADSWYERCARKHGLATASELDATSRAWLEWSRSPDAYLAFAWCRALGRKPS